MGLPARKFEKHYTYRDYRQWPEDERWELIGGVAYAMSEQSSIDPSFRPNTIDSLADDLVRLGVRPGMHLLVHSSLRSLGWVCGGAPAVILALEKVLTRRGTLMMPTHSGDLSDPAQWRHPPVPASWWPTIRETMPVFDRDLTPTRGMGAIPETFRKQRGVLRSSHPNSSFAAWGRKRKFLLQDHHLDHQMNRQSPLGRLYDLGGHVLLLGVGYESNTSFHLAEYLSGSPALRTLVGHAPVLEGGQRVWKAFEDIEFGGDDFEEMGREFERVHGIRQALVGRATAKLLDQRALVDFAVGWMNRQGSDSSPLS